MPLALGSSSIFSRSELQKAIQESIPDAVMKDHELAIVAGVTKEGIRVAVVFQKDTTLGKWRFEGAYQKNLDGGQQLAGQITFIR